MLVALLACTTDPVDGGGDPPLYDVPLAPDSPWPKFRRDAAQQARGVYAATTAGASEPWTFATGKGIFSSPVIGGDGTIYVGSADRRFYALAPDGTERWSFETGEIIDSAALLDDQGLVYFGSGDGHLYALDAATGEEVWSFEAEHPDETGAFIRWFEGNVGILPTGDLVVPNDNFRVYGLDRADGAVRWSAERSDQTWSLPAVDAATGRAFIGNNNLLGAVDGNTFAIDGLTGAQAWESADALGSVAASPLLADGLVVVGAFDGTLRAHDADTGQVVWTFDARDHLYASPARLSDGTLVQPGADGTLYAIDPADGALVWAFDTPEPIRASPAVGADDVIYVGGGDGRLYVLEPDGALRWSMTLIEGDRNDLNASPALGPDGIVLAGESGEIFLVPYDWCATADDERCHTGGEELPPDGAFVWLTTRFGTLSPTPPSSIGPTEPLALSLVLREGGDTVLALFDTTSVEVTADPPVPLEVTVSADRRFLTVLPPATGWVGEQLELTVAGQALVDPEREGLRFEGGVPHGPVAASFSFEIDRSGPRELPGGAPGATWELYRLAAPLPTILPSYNQIGFDSLHYLVSLVEWDGRQGVGVVIGALPGGVPDPATRAVFPVEVTWADGGLHLRSRGGMSLEVMNVTVAFDDFRIAGRLDATGAAVGGAVLAVSAGCADIPLYGTFLRQLGFCNPDTDGLEVFGAALLEPREPTAVTVDELVFTREADAVVATFTASFPADVHHLGLLVIDDATGLPVPLDYGTATEVSEVDGRIEVRLAATELPETVRVHLMVDTWPAGWGAPGAP